MPTSKRMRTRSEEFTNKDIVEIALGGFIMGFPAAVTEEVWTLGAELSLTRALLFSLASLFVLAILIYALHGHGDAPKSRDTFLRRVVATYFVTLLIAALLLFGIDRLELLDNPLVALKRTILVAFPASFAATVVNSIGSNGADR